MEHSTTEGAGGRPQDDKALIGAWVTMTEMFGDDVAQEAMTVTLAAIEKGALKKPPQHFFRTVANTLARRGYDDAIEDKYERHHQGVLRSCSRLGEHTANGVMSVMYASGVVLEDGEIDYLSEQRATLFEADWKTRPAPARVSPLKRAFYTNLRDWKGLGELAFSGPVRERPPEPPAAIEAPEPTPPETTPKRRLPKGITWDRTTERWRVRRKKGGKMLINRPFRSLAEAIRALEAALAA